MGVSPSYGLAGGLVTLRALQYTDLYEANREQTAKGREARFTRVYFHGQKCELRKPDSDQ